MTWLAWLSLAVLGGAVVCLVVGHLRVLPADKGEWDRLLTADSERLLGQLELLVLSDAAMAGDTLSRAMAAKKSMAFGEAIRLVDLAYNVLCDAARDRATRLKGMSQAIRMASAMLPLEAVSPVGLRLVEVRGLFAAGTVLHHMLVSSIERWLLRVMLMRFAYRLSLRAMSGGASRIRANPMASAAWARCDSAVKDWTVHLDPALVEGMRVMLASVVAERAMAADQEA